MKRTDDAAHVLPKISEVSSVAEELMYRRVAALLALLCLAPAPAEAQRTFKAIGEDLWTDVGDIWYVWTSPFHANASDWKDSSIGSTTPHTKDRVRCSSRRRLR